LRLFFAGTQQQIVVCGHTHMQFERHLDSLRIVNAGSVGMPYADQPGAYWLLLGPDITFKHTSYDLAEAAARISASGYPGAQKFVEENVLNIPSAAEATEFFEQLAAKQELR
jgi:diadenosine tetraphosphatase ApaH/serine/threonine PP2A family protein phosphatase